MKRIKNRLEEGIFKNEIFRKILYTNKYLQVALLRLNPGSVVGLKTHSSMDQFIGFEGEEGKCIVEGQEYKVESGDVIIIPACSKDEVTAIKCHKKALDSYKFFNSDKKDGFVRVSLSDL